MIIVLLLNISFTVVNMALCPLMLIADLPADLRHSVESGVICYETTLATLNSLYTLLYIPLPPYFIFIQE